MKVSNVSSQNFGLRISDNLSLQTLKYMWIKNSSSARVIKALNDIKACADDSFELTINKVYNVVPELIIRKSGAMPELMNVKFYELQEITKRQPGRPRKDAQPNYRQVALSPEIVVAEIIERISKYKQRLF